MRRTQLGQLAGLLLPVRGLRDPIGHVPACEHCGTRVSKVEIVEGHPGESLTAKILVTCRRHRNSLGGTHAEHLHTVHFLSREWDHEELAKQMRGVRWFASDVSQDGLSDKAL